MARHQRRSQRKRIEYFIRLFLILLPLFAALVINDPVFLNRAITPPALKLSLPLDHLTSSSWAALIWPTLWWLLKYNFNFSLTWHTRDSILLMLFIYWVTNKQTFNFISAVLTYLLTYQASLFHFGWNIIIDKINGCPKMLPKMSTPSFVWTNMCACISCMTQCIYAIATADTLYIFSHVQVYSLTRP
jgi:hypothetical protein